MLPAELLVVGHVEADHEDGGEEDHEDDDDGEDHQVVEGRGFGDGSRVILVKSVSGGARERWDMGEDVCQIEHFRSGSAVSGFVFCKYRDLAGGQVGASILSF